MYYIATDSLQYCQGGRMHAEKNNTHAGMYAYAHTHTRIHNFMDFIILSACQFCGPSGKKGGKKRVCLTEISGWLLQFSKRERGVRLCSPVCPPVQTKSLRMTNWVSGNLVKLRERRQWFGFGSERPCFFFLRILGWKYISFRTSKLPRMGYAEMSLSVCLFVCTQACCTARTRGREDYLVSEISQVMDTFDGFICSPLPSLYHLSLLYILWTAIVLNWTAFILLALDLTLCTVYICTASFSSGWL